MGGFEIQCTDATHRLRIAEIKYLITSGALPVSSIAVTEEEISDRSKTDRLSRLITCLQILWFVVQLTGRAVQRLSTTGLELFTLGIVVYSLGTYAAYWRRPQDIHLPITLPVGTGKSLHDVFGEPISPRAKVAWGDIDRDSSSLSFSLCLTAGITGIFGACHLIGWDFLYPSSVEQLLWRISSTFCVAIPFLLALLVYTDRGQDDEDFGIFTLVWSVRYLVRMSLLSLAFLHTLARVYLLVAVFISLRSVPAGVYQTVNWSLYIPHL
ncbi:hypothetical protein V8E54_009829 [Elaphomyces granulatus]